VPGGCPPPLGPGAALPDTRRGRRGAGTRRPPPPAPVPPPPPAAPDNARPALAPRSPPLGPLTESHPGRGPRRTMASLRRASALVSRGQAAVGGLSATGAAWRAFSAAGTPASSEGSTASSAVPRSSPRRWKLEAPQRGDVALSGELRCVGSRATRTWRHRRGRAACAQESAPSCAPFPPAGDDLRLPARCASPESPGDTPAPQESRGGKDRARPGRGCRRLGVPALRAARDAGAAEVPGPAPPGPAPLGPPRPLPPPPDPRPAPAPAPAGSFSPTTGSPGRWRRPSRRPGRTRRRGRAPRGPAGAAAAPSARGPSRCT